MDTIHKYEAIGDLRSAKLEAILMKIEEEIMEIRSKLLLYTAVHACSFIYLHYLLTVMVQASAV